MFWSFRNLEFCKFPMPDGAVMSWYDLWRIYLYLGKSKLEMCWRRKGWFRLRLRLVRL